MASCLFILIPCVSGSFCSDLPHQHKGRISMGDCYYASDTPTFFFLQTCTLRLNNCLWCWTWFMKSGMFQESLDERRYIMKTIFSRSSTYYLGTCYCTVKIYESFVIDLIKKRKPIVEELYPKHKYLSFFNKTCRTMHACSNICG